jgi:hypothetical protein
MWRWIKMRGGACDLEGGEEYIENQGFGIDAGEALRGRGVQFE